MLTAMARSSRDRVSGGTRRAPHTGTVAINTDTPTSIAQRYPGRGPPTRQKLGSANSAVSNAAPSRAKLVGHLKISGSNTSSATNRAQA